MAFVQPNLYVLSGGGIHVTYSPTSFNGQPHLTYSSPFVSRTFTGNEITTTASPIGTLVTVTIMLTVDAGSTTFTLLVPVVNLNNNNDIVAITTEGVTTHHRFSIFPPALHGQIETYAVTQLTGNAEHVLFVAPVHQKVA
jgi:hypothetical protein